MSMCFSITQDTKYGLARIYEFQQCQNNNATIVHFQELHSAKYAYSTSIHLIHGAWASQSMDLYRDQGTRTSVCPRVLAKQQANSNKGSTSISVNLGLKDSPNYGEREMERYRGRKGICRKLNILQVARFQKHRHSHNECEPFGKAVIFIGVLV